MFFASSVTANYKLEDGSEKLVEHFDLNISNLDKKLSRKEFVETLYVWYKEYRSERGLYVNYDKYSQLNNDKYFTDIDLNSDF